MSIAAPPREHDAFAGVEHDPIEALVEEARERARRRRRLYGVAASVVAIAVAAAIFGFNGAGSSPGQPSALDAAAEAPVRDLGVFEPIRGWIVFPDGAGIGAVDPDNPLSRHTVLANPEGISSHLSPIGWSADGSELALIDEGESGSWIMDSTGSLINVAGPGGCCAFVSNAARFSISLDAGDRITDLKPLLQIGHTALSADGERLLLTAPGDQEFSWLASNPATTRGLYVAVGDGSLLDGSLHDGSAMRRIAAGSYVAAVWSPDSTRIAAISATPVGRELVVMNADGTGKQALVQLDSDLFTGIAWHPVAP